MCGKIAPCTCGNQDICTTCAQPYGQEIGKAHLRLRLTLCGQRACRSPHQIGGRLRGPMVGAGQPFKSRASPFDPAGQRMALRWMLCVAVLVGCLPSLHDSDRRCRLRASVPAFGAVITRRSPRCHSIVRTFGPLGHFGPRIRSSTAKPRLYASSSVLNVSDDCLTKVGLVSPRTISQTKPFGPDFRALTTSRSGGRTSPAGDGVMGRLAIFSVYSRRMITASVDLASAKN